MPTLLKRPMKEDMMTKYFYAIILTLLLSSSLQAYTLKGYNEGWQDFQQGQWRYLLNYQQSSDDFEEIEVRLNSHQDSVLPINTTDAIRIIHLTQGDSLKVIIHNPQKTEYILSNNDVIVIGSKLDFQVQSATKVVFDVTISEKSQNPKFFD